jgi:membrane protease YdiL (CAAX protease family)
MLGILWAFWHIPMFLGANLPMSIMPLAVAFFIPGTLVYTWIYNRTGGSLLLLVFTHMGSHLNNSHLVLPANTTPFIVHTITFWIAAIALLLLDRKAWRAPAAQG